MYCCASCVDGINSGASPRLVLRLSEHWSIASGGGGTTRSLVPVHETSGARRFCRGVAALTISSSLPQLPRIDLARPGGLRRSRRRSRINEVLTPAEAGYFVLCHTFPQLTLGATFFRALRALVRLFVLMSGRFHPHTRGRVCHAMAHPSPTTGERAGHPPCKVKTGNINTAYFLPGGKEFSSGISNYRA